MGLKVKVHNLCRVKKTKYLVVSPVMDNYEQLDNDGRKNLITIFKKLKLI